MLNKNILDFTSVSDKNRFNIHIAHKCPNLWVLSTPRMFLTFSKNTVPNLGTNYVPPNTFFNVYLPNRSNKHIFCRQTKSIFYIVALVVGHQNPYLCKCLLCGL